MSPSDLLATPVLNAFQNVALAIIIERQNKLNFSDQCQTKFLLPKSQNEFYDLLTIPSCTSPAKTKAKDMENILIFHVTLRIQILTVFSVQSKYSKKTKSILLLGFVISNKTCSIWDVQIRCQPSRLISPSRWKTNSLRPMQKISNGFISPQMSNFHKELINFFFNEMQREPLESFQKVSLEASCCGRRWGPCQVGRENTRRLG